MRRQRILKKHLNFVSEGILLFMIWHIVHIINFRFLKCNDAKACILDAIVNMVWVKCSVILIIFAVLEYIYSERNEYSIMQIVRSRSRKDLFFEKYRELVFLCIFWSILFVSISIVTGFFLTEGTWINWNDAGSYYQTQVVGQAVNSNVSIVLIAAGCLVFLQMNVMLTFSLVMAWFFDSYMFALLPIVAVGLNDLHDEWIPVFFGRFTIKGAMWGNADERWMWRMVCLILIEMILLVLGRRVAERKEFFGAKSIGK